MTNQATKKVYLWGENSLFIGDYDAQLNPIDLETYIEPILSTDEAPSIVEGTWPKRVDGNWVNVPDFRDQVWYDQTTGEQVLIADIGQPAANLGSSQPQLFALAEAKTQQKAIIQSACSDAITSGVKSLALGVEHVYPSQQVDQLNLTAIVVRSMLPGFTTKKFKTLDAGWLDHNAAQIQQVGINVSDFISTQLEKSATLQGQINSAATIELVQSIIW